MKAYKFIVMVIVAGFLLIGCKQEISSTLYVGDIMDALSSKEPVLASAAVKLEMPTSKMCGEKKEKLSRIISPFFNGLKKVQCIKEGTTAFYYAVFDVPLLKVNDKGELNNNYKGGVSVQLNDNGQEIGIYLSMNLNLLSALDRDLNNEFMGSGGINLEDMKVKIAINNDSRKWPYELIVEGAFLDGRAVIPKFGQTVELKRSAESVVTLSDVSVFALLGKGSTSFAYLGAIKPKISIP